jgi:GH24 family phage-related lysozyme (muramidase)
VSFTYNEGAGRLQTSTLLKVLNAGKYEAVPAEFMKWVFGGGVKLPGLVTRRAAEAALFEATQKSPSLISTLIYYGSWRREPVSIPFTT